MPTHDRPLLKMVVLCGLCYQWVLLDCLRPGGAIREKCRILDGKGETVMDHKFGASMVVAPTCVD
jgi:hypothetical protein